MEPAKKSTREFLKYSHLATADIQTLWDEFVTKLQHGIDTHIPIRKARSNNGLLWINQEIRRLISRRDRYYKIWVRSRRPTDQKKFIEYKHLVRQVSDMAYVKYIGDILGLQQEADDLDIPTKVSTKELYSLLNHSRQDNSGITSLKANGQTFTSDGDKVNTITQQFTSDGDKVNTITQQFQSVFSPKSPTTLNALVQKTLQDLHESGINQPFQTSPYTKMPLCVKYWNTQWLQIHLGTLRTRISSIIYSMVSENGSPVRPS